MKVTELTKAEFLNKVADYPYRCSYPSLSVRCSMISFSYHSSFSGSMDVMLFRENSETVRDSTLETAIVHPTNIWILSQTIFRFSLSINLSSGCNQHECLLFFRLRHAVLFLFSRTRKTPAA